MKALGPKTLQLLFIGFSRAFFVLAMVSLFGVLSESIGKSLPIFGTETVEYWIIFVACLFLSLFLDLMAKNSENRSLFNRFDKNKSAPKKALQSVSAQTPETAATQLEAQTEAFPNSSMSIHSARIPVSQEDMLKRLEITEPSQIQTQTIKETDGEKTEAETEATVKVHENPAAEDMSVNGEANILDIEIETNALNYLEKNGNVFILTNFENPKYSYSKIKGYDAKLLIDFVEFVEICKTYPDNSLIEFTTSAFSPTSPADSKHDLGFYLDKSGFSTVDDWLKTVKDENAIPECSTGYKIFYIYHVRTIKKS